LLGHGLRASRPYQYVATCRVGLGRVVLSRVEENLKGKVFPYSLPSVGPGADPGVQAVSPQVT